MDSLLKLSLDAGVLSRLAHFLVSVSGVSRGGDHSGVPTVVHSVSFRYGVHETFCKHVTFSVAKSSSPSDVSLKLVV